MQCIPVKSDEFELLYFFLNPVHVAARSLRSLHSSELRSTKKTNLPTKAEEISIIRISFRNQDSNIKIDTIRNPRQNSELSHIHNLSKSANPLDLPQKSTIRMLLRGEILNYKSVAKEISKPPFLAPEVHLASKFAVFVRFTFPLWRQRGRVV